MSLDAAHGALEGVNISEAEDLTITWAAQRLLILLIHDGSHVILDFSGEELIECAELIDVLNLNLIKVDPIELSEAKVHVLSHIRGQGAIGQEPSHLTRSP